jgi:hypothetical protein
MIRATATTSATTRKVGRGAGLYLAIADIPVPDSSPFNEDLLPPRITILSPSKTFQQLPRLHPRCRHRWVCVGSARPASTPARTSAPFQVHVTIHATATHNFTTAIAIRIASFPSAIVAAVVLGLNLCSGGSPPTSLFKIAPRPTQPPLSRTTQLLLRLRSRCRYQCRTSVLPAFGVSTLAARSAPIQVLVTTYATAMHSFTTANVGILRIAGFESAIAVTLAPDSNLCSGDLQMARCPTSHMRPMRFQPTKL